MRAQTIHARPDEPNFRVYNDPEVASHYAALEYLTPCEQLLFDAYIRPGMAVLDLGVGGGRTTPYLSGKASSYVGVDYSEEMIRICRRKFPGLDFRINDAVDLSAFADFSFDAIVIAFNGLDYVFPGQRRRQCLEECHRVLRAGGVLIFSSHNPRSIWIPPAWDPKRLRAAVQLVVPEQNAFFDFFCLASSAAKSAHAVLRAVIYSATRMVRRLPQATFWRGEGYLLDPAHDGLMTHYWVPGRAVAEVAGFGFQVAAIMGNDYPSRSHGFVTDWYYYVFSKTGSVSGESCA